MNKAVLTIVFLLSVVLLSNIAFADYEINDVTFKTGDFELTHILYQHPQIVDIFLNFTTNESFTSLHADLTTLNPDPNFLMQYRDKGFFCVKDDNQTTEGFDDYHCHILDIIFNPQGVNVSINMTFFDSKKNHKTTYNKTFLIDDTKPQLKRFETGFCKGEKCFIPSALPTKIYVELTDSEATFNQEKIFYRIGDGQQQRVTSCEGKLCEGIYTQTSCESQERVSAEIVQSRGIPSSDDAGNPIEGTLKRTFICDKTAPATENIAGEDVPIIINITHSDSSIYPNPKSGDTINIKMIVSEDASGLTASSNLTKLGGDFSTTTCDVNPGGLDYTCEFKVENVISGTHTLRVDFEDGVGRTNYKTFDVQVDEYIIPDDGRTPKFLKDITAKSPAERGFNRVALALAEKNNIIYPLYVTFKPEKNLAVPGSVELLSTRIDSIDKASCTLYQDGVLSKELAISAFNFDIVDPLAKFEDENKISLKLKADPNDITDNTKIICNISAIVRIDGKKVYREPTKFLLTIPLKFKNSRLGDDAPGERYIKKIHEYQKSTKTLYSLVGFMNKIYANLQDICKAQKFMLGVSQGGVALNYMSSIMQNQVLGQLLGGAGGVLSSVGTVGQKSADMANKMLIDTDAQKASGWSKNTPSSWTLKDILSQACQLSTCSVDSNSRDKTDFAFNGNQPAYNFFEQYKTPLPDDKKEPLALDDKTVSNPYGDAALSEIFKDVNVPDVKGSLVSAITARCLPAVVYHLNQFRQMNCKTINCMKTQAAYGTDISVCEQAKSQFICEKVVGEIFDIGGVRQVKNIMDNTNNLIQGAVPNALKLLTTNTYCKGYATITNDYLGTSIAKDGVQKNDLMKLTLCAIPEVIQNTANYNRKSNPSKRTFEYEVEDDACVLAYCSSINPEECGGASPSFIQRMFPNMNIPSSTLSTLSGQLLTTEDEVKDPYKGLTAKEKEKLQLKEDNEIEAIFNEINPKPTDEKPTEAEDSTAQPTSSSFKDILTTYEANIKASKTSGLQEEDVINYIAEGINLMSRELNKLSKLTDSQSQIKDNFELNKGIFLINRFSSSEGKKAAKYFQDDSVDALKSMGITEVESGNDGDAIDYSKFETFEKNYDVLEKDDSVDEMTKAEYVVRESKQIVNVPSKDVDGYNQLVTKAEKYVEANKEVFDAGMQSAAQDYFKTQNDNLKKLEKVITKEKVLLDACTNEKCEQLHRANINMLYEQWKKQKRLVNSINSDGEVDVAEVRNLKRDALIVKKKQIEGILDPLANMALEKGWLNWASLSSFGSDTTLGKVSDWSNKWLSSDSYKNKICSANFIKPKDSSNQKGSAIQCEENFCLPVLTQAVEKTRLNSTHMLYIATYTIGNVKAPDKFSEKENISFNIFFKDGNTLSEKLFNLTWFKINYGDVAGDSFAFISPNNFDEMCIIFEYKFPPTQIGNKKQYCRPIIENTRGESDFDTGSPMPANFEDEAQTIVQTSPGKAPMNII